MKNYDYKSRKKYPISISKNPVTVRINLPPLPSVIIKEKISNWFLRILKRIINFIWRSK